MFIFTLPGHGTWLMWNFCQISSLQFFPLKLFKKKKKKEKKRCFGFVIFFKPCGVKLDVIWNL